MVNKVKGKATDTLFEKSRLVIQGFNDDGKEFILTQSPTIQRASQRVIVALAPALIKNGMAVYLRDITQAYTQSETHLQRLILAHLPDQIRQSYERRELFEIRWINGQDNPADAMTKANPNKALETFVNTNTLYI